MKVVGLDPLPSVGWAGALLPGRRNAVARPIYNKPGAYGVVVEVGGSNTAGSGAGA